MSEARFPAMPEWMDEADPPADAKVNLKPARPIAPGWISRTDEITSRSGQTFQVTVSAEKRNRAELEEYGESLYMVMEVVPDPPELKELMDQLDALAAKDDGSTTEATIEWAKKHYREDPLILVQTEMTSAGSSVTWAAKWSKLAKAGDYEVWHGPKWVKMEVRIGGADLRGVNPATGNRYGGQETVWTVGSGRCSVHALSQCDYRLPAAWRT
jgi:hypothetical protein